MYKERKLSEIVKNDNNPRCIREQNFETLVESVRGNPDYFKARPIIISDRTGELVIVAGNQRYEAAKRIGLKKVPTYLLQGLTEEKEREILIRDNINNGEWDMDILAQSFDAGLLKDFGLDIPTADDYDEKISLKTGAKDDREEITFTFSDEQKMFLEAIFEAYADLPEAKANKNLKGNIIYYFVQQWENAKK
jgi:hypothetical protein